MGKSARAAALSDNIRQKRAFELMDLILQHELALLQALNLQKIRSAIGSLDQAGDHFIQVTMFHPQFFEFAA